LRPRPDLDPRLWVEFAVAFDKTALERLDDHRSGFVKALARLVHAQPEGGELPPRQAAPEPQPQPPLAEHVEHRRLLGDAQRVMPGQDHRRRTQVDIGAERRHVGHQLQIVGHE
jgi:hypothetical protein